MCIETTEGEKGLRLGFRIDPENVLLETARTAKRMKKAYEKMPVYGIDGDVADVMKAGYYEVPFLLPRRKKGEGCFDEALCLAVDRASIPQSVADSWRLGQLR